MASGRLYRAFDYREARKDIIPDATRVDLLIATGDRELRAQLAERIGSARFEFTDDTSQIARLAARLQPRVVIIDGRAGESSHPALMLPAISQACSAAIIIVTARNSERLKRLAAHACAYDVIATTERDFVNLIVESANLGKRDSAKVERITVVH